MEPRYTVFYDGVCGLCDRVTQLILANDTHDRFRYAALQGAYAQRAIAAHGVVLDPEHLDTLYVLTPEGRLLERSDAAIAVLAQLDRTRRLARVALLIPRVLRDAVYWVISKSRYAIFGRSAVCRVPSVAERDKFIPNDAA